MAFQSSFSKIFYNTPVNKLATVRLELGCKLQTHVCNAVETSKKTGIQAPDNRFLSCCVANFKGQ